RLAPRRIEPIGQRPRVFPPLLRPDAVWRLRIQQRSGEPKSAAVDTPRDLPGQAGRFPKASNERLASEDGHQPTDQGALTEISQVPLPFLCVTADTAGQAASERVYPNVYPDCRRVPQEPSRHLAGCGRRHRREDTHGASKYCANGGSLPRASSGIACDPASERANDPPSNSYATRGVSPPQRILV